MKVYVDELPESCCDCPCDDDSLGCYFGLDSELHKRAEWCPLQTISEHDKQVRKEVVQEIREQLNFWYDGYEEEYSIHKECLEDILKEAENSCKKS